MIPPLAIYLLSSVAVLVVIRKYRESKWGKCKNAVQLNKKVVVVTGANSGIGYEIAKELAARNAQVILACRRLSLANIAIDKIRSNIDNENLFAMELDLASLKSVEKFTQELTNKFPEIHILVNNAGVSYPKTKREKTSDGVEIHFGVNHLGHFHLTNLVLDHLPPSSRIIVIASQLHEKGAIYLDDLNFEKQHEKSNLYANSKLANVYFAKELAKKTKEKGINVYAVCPGWVYSGLFRHSVKWYHYILVAPIAFFFMRSSQQGSQTAIYCATEPSLDGETGELYRDCKKYKSKMSFDDNVSKKLWTESQKIIDVVLHK